MASLHPQVHIDDPDILLPKLPKPKDLQPFPSTESIVSIYYTLSISYGVCRWSTQLSLNHSNRTYLIEYTNTLIEQSPLLFV